MGKKYRKDTYMNEQTVFIPTNFTDAGRLLGMFEIRNVIECAVLCIPALLLLMSISPFGLTGTIILCSAVLIPLGGFSLGGIQDYSLFTFIRLHRRFKKNKRILTYRGSKWLKKK